MNHGETLLAARDARTLKLGQPVKAMFGTPTEYEWRIGIVIGSWGGKPRVQFYGGRFNPNIICAMDVDRLTLITKDEYLAEYERIKAADGAEAIKAARNLSATRHTEQGNGTSAAPPFAGSLEVLVNGKWTPAKYAGRARGLNEFWAKTESGSAHVFKVHEEGDKWRRR